MRCMRLVQFFIVLHRMNGSTKHMCAHIWMPTAYISLYVYRWMMGVLLFAFALCHTWMLDCRRPFTAWVSFKYILRLILFALWEHIATSHICVWLACMELDQLIQATTAAYLRYINSNLISSFINKLRSLLRVLFLLLQYLHFFSLFSLILRNLRNPRRKKMWVILIC